MQSTVNYLWHTDDLLGQGATASVYKARNKVGPRPGPRGPPPARSAPAGTQAVCGWAEASGLGLAHSGVGDAGGLSRSVGAAEGSSAWCFREAQFGTGESDEDTKLTPGR